MLTRVRRVAAVATVVLTPVVWPLGVLLLWLSTSWHRKSKLIGTFILPGGCCIEMWLRPFASRSAHVQGGTEA
jgi:hypothetical protein